MDGILRALGGPETVDEVTVYVTNEVLGGDKLVARGNDGGLKVALECLDGLYLGAKRVEDVLVGVWLLVASSLS
ncbi:MAG: hypothetical protein E7C13_09465 [Actinomyces sp.]|nr:hypothetical protein [Actinomyces sp.]